GVPGGVAVTGAVAAGVDEAVVIESSPLARVAAAGGGRAPRAAVARAHCRLAAGRLAREGDAAEVDHGVLHGHFDVLAPARALALMQGGQDADGAVQPGARVADGRSRLEGLGLRRARQAQGSAHGLSDHVEAHVVLVGALAKALDLRVDETRIDLP